MNTLQAGFSRVNITPMMGIPVAGYFKPRFADGVLDDLEINTLALSDGIRTALLIAIDNVGMGTSVYKNYQKHVAEVTGIPEEAVFISATHTHTAAYIDENRTEESAKEHMQFVRHKIADGAKLAIDDLKPANMGYGVGKAPNVAFIRRFRMKDGSVRTNPGVGNPDILSPIGDVDERVNVLRFDREGADTIVLANFGNHPDVVGGCKISADWPGMLRRTVEKTIDNTKCLFFNGAEGDVNHVNVHPTEGDLNDMFMDFDDVSRGYGHARYVGRVVAGGVLQAYDKVNYTDVDSVRFAQRIIDLPSQRPAKDEIPEAKYICDMHDAGRDDELPYQGMLLTTFVAEARRKVKLENGPDAFPTPLSAIVVGPVAFIGIGGEPFTGIGRALKETEGFDLVFPCSSTGACDAYYPMQDAYDEGGYEARSSLFKAGVAERIIEEGKRLLKDIGEQT